MTLPAHSKIGASSMSRWANCPGSVRESAKVEARTSVYAAEGTVAHDIAAQCLTSKKRAEDFIGKSIEQDGYKIEVTEEMVDAINVYLQTVRADYASHPERPIQLVEHKFHLKDLHPDLHGTADLTHIWVQRKHLAVYDYKHGAGVAVDVKGNLQELYYATGALLECQHPIKTVELCIVQPRCPHPDGPVRRWTIDAIDLIDWSADLLEAVKRTEDPNAPLKPGDWCRFCPAAAICPELKNKAQALAKLEFGPTLSYDPKVLADTLAWLPVLEGWIKAVREFAYGEADHGRCPPGWKLVEKRPTRDWIDVGDAIIKLKNMGLNDEQIFKREIRSPAQIEKEVGKGRMDELAPLIKKQSSGTTLVPESDPREPVRKDAKSEFAIAG